MDYFKIKSETQGYFKDESIRNIKISLFITKIMRFLYVENNIRILFAVISVIISLLISSVSGNYIIIPIGVALSFIISYFVVKELNITDEKREQDIIHDTILEILEEKKN
jgi:hypothetical protein